LEVGNHKNCHYGARSFMKLSFCKQLIYDTVILVQNNVQKCHGWTQAIIYTISENGIFGDNGSGNTHFKDNHALWVVMLLVLVCLSCLVACRSTLGHCSR